MDDDVPARLLRGEVTMPENSMRLDTMQVLVTVWPDGSAEIATRADDYETWSPPVRLQDWPTT